MPYVYRHIRLDKNEPFYIGIGKDNSYKRAFEKDKRNKFWKNIVSKTNYEVEILIDDLSWEVACEKEKEFISLYGRKDLNTGTLVNLTNGGDGANGAIRNQKFKQNLSIKRTGINHHKWKGYLIQLDKNQKIINVFINSYEAKKVTGICNSNILKSVKDNRRTAGGYYWKIEKGSVETPPDFNQKLNAMRLLRYLM
jgi:hypothetical protein